MPDNQRETATRGAPDVIAVHPIAQLFPLMDEKAFRDPVSDLETDGQLSPIWLYDGQNIDRYNRFSACLDLGLTPQVRVWDQKGDLVSFVLGLNLRRRHLTAMQKEVVAYRVLPILEAKAKEKRARRVPDRLPESFPERQSDARNEAENQTALSKKGMCCPAELTDRSYNGGRTWKE